MSKRVKLKMKRGKIKFKLKSGDDALPLSEASLHGLLVQAVASVAELGSDRRALIDSGERVEPAALLMSGVREEDSGDATTGVGGEASTRGASLRPEPAE